MPAGRLALSWNVAGAMLRLRWQERGGPSVEPSAHVGFGTLLIEQSAAAQGGEARVTYGDGVTWDISLALPQAVLAPGPTMSGQAASAPSRQPPEALAGRRFLVIEDEPIIAMQITSLLKAAGTVLAGRPAPSSRPSRRSRP